MHDDLPRCADCGFSSLLLIGNVWQCQNCGADWLDEIPLLDDIAQVLDAALGNALAKDIVPELHRVRQRIATTLV